MRIAMFGVALVAFGATACVSWYQQPVKSEPVATIDLVKGYNSGLGFGHGATQVYAVVDDETCAHPQRAGFFAWMNSNPIQIRASAARELRIAVYTDYSAVTSVTGTGYGYVANSEVLNRCGTYVAFTPESGHAYEIAQREIGKTKTCKSTVIDKATGAPPPGLKLQEPFLCPGKARPQ